MKNYIYSNGFAIGYMNGENLIYWQGCAIGIDCGNYVSWFPSAPKEAIEALSAK